MNQRVLHQLFRLLQSGSRPHPTYPRSYQRYVAFCWVAVKELELSRHNISKYQIMGFVVRVIETVPNSNPVFRSSSILSVRPAKS